MNAAVLKDFMVRIVRKLHVQIIRVIMMENVLLMKMVRSHAHVKMVTVEAFVRLILASIMNVFMAVVKLKDRVTFAFAIRDIPASFVNLIVVMIILAKITQPAFCMLILQSASVFRAFSEIFAKKIIVTTTLVKTEDAKLEKTRSHVTVASAFQANFVR